MTFKGKFVAITGAAGGIGQALCRRFGAGGARIGAIDRHARVHELAAALAKEGIDAAAEIADVGDPDAVAKSFERLISAHGGVDVLVNNAGFSSHSTLSRTDPAGWRGDVNGLAALGDPAYSAAKAGMISLTRSLAQEYGRYGIRVNIVLPGTVRTPIWAERVKKDAKVRATLGRWYPLGRIVEPEEIASVVAFLASDDARAITGAALPVDCGLTAGNIVMARELTLEDF